MDYDSYMQDIAEYLKHTELGKPSQFDKDLGPITGASEAEIDAAEKKIGKTFPEALRAWYRVAGKVPPYLNDHGWWFDLDELIFVQDVVNNEEEEEPANFSPKDTRLQIPEVIALAARLGDNIAFLDLREGEPEDPSMFFVRSPYPPQTIDPMECSFSAFIRAHWLIWLDGYYQINHNIRVAEISTIDKMRRDFANRLYQEDLKRGHLTTIRQYQAQWRTYFASTELYQTLVESKSYIPYDWIESPV